MKLETLRKPFLPDDPPSSHLLPHEIHSLGPEQLLPYHRHAIPKHAISTLEFDKCTRLEVIPRPQSLHPCALPPHSRRPPGYHP